MCIAKTVPATLSESYIPGGVVMKYQSTPVTAPNIANNSRTHTTVLLFRGLLWTGSLAVLTEIMYVCT